MVRVELQQVELQREPPVHRRGENLDLSHVWPFSRRNKLTFPNQATITRRDDLEENSSESGEVDAHQIELQLAQNSQFPYPNPSVIQRQVKILRGSRMKL